MGRRTGVSALRNPGGAHPDVNWRGTSGCVFRAYPPAPVKKSLMGVCALALLGSTISSSLGRAPSEIPLPRVARLFYWYRAAPMLQGVSYVQNSAVYIRNIIPDDMSIPWLAVLADRGGAMQEFIADSFGPSTKPRGKDYWRHEEDQSGPSYRG